MFTASASTTAVAAANIAGFQKWWNYGNWCRGVVGSAFRLKRSYSTPGPVSTAMGDCLWAGKPSRCEDSAFYTPWDGKMSSNSFTW